MISHSAKINVETITQAFQSSSWFLYCKRTCFDINDEIYLSLTRGKDTVFMRSNFQMFIESSKLTPQATILG